MSIPPAEIIEGTHDELERDNAMAADLVRCSKELHTANPPFIRDLSPEQFSLVARAYFLGLKVAKHMIDGGARL